jgi:hypothetical protein
MTGRIWLAEHPEGNEYNKHNKEKEKWLPEILNMTGWKIVFLSFTFPQPCMKWGGGGTRLHNFI